MMSKKRIAFFLFTVVVLIGIGSTSCNRTSPSSESEDVAVVITPVTIAPVTYKPVTETIDLPSVTVYLTKNIVRSATTGTVETISVAIGDKVKKDQLLYIIRTREASAMSSSIKGDTTLSFSGRIKITASQDGVISSVSHQSGDFVQEGDELAVISEQGSLVFILDSPFEYVKEIEKNKKCKIHLPDNLVIDGIIYGKLPEMDPQAQTVRYMIKPVSAAQLPANLNAIVSIIKSTRENAIVLPKSAVLSNETETEFWVMKLLNDTVAIKIPVTKGFENNDEVEITSPEFLKSDRIILTGSYGLPDTARVIIK
jgi:multidrug efflux pump subunit AcrA (membrane-fusion protein)